MQSAALRHAIRDLVLANTILARDGVIDDFGHVGVRHPENLDRYLLAAGRGMRRAPPWRALAHRPRNQPRMGLLGGARRLSGNVM